MFVTDYMINEVKQYFDERVEMIDGFLKSYCAYDAPFLAVYKALIEEVRVTCESLDLSNSQF